MATKQYKTLAREFHADKGGDAARFDEIKCARNVLADTRHKEEKNPGPNLLYKYVLENDHEVFNEWLKEQNASANTDPGFNRHRRPNTSNAVNTKKKPKSRLMIESGRPQQCKMPQITTIPHLSKEIEQERDEGEKEKLRQQDATMKAMIKSGKMYVKLAWGPRHHLAANFELEIEKDGGETSVTSGAPEFSHQWLDFPGDYTFRVRASNEQGFGLWSVSVPAELDDLGRLTKAYDHQRRLQELQSSRSTFLSTCSKAERKLRIVVEQYEEQLLGTVHAEMRQTIIAQLKHARLQGERYVNDEALKHKADALLIHLQAKELTREWRVELKKWTERLVNTEDALSNAEVDLEVRIGLQALQPDRLNWLYQHVLTRTNKVIASYTKASDLTKMPIADRDSHQRLACLLKLTLINNNVFGRRDEFCHKLADLRKAIERGVAFEEKAKSEEYDRRHAATLQYVLTKQAAQERLELERQQRAALRLENQQRNAQQLDQRVKESGERERQRRLEAMSQKSCDEEAEQNRREKLATHRERERANTKRAEEAAAQRKRDAAQAKRKKAEAAAEKQRVDALQQRQRIKAEEAAAAAAHKQQQRDYAHRQMQRTKAETAAATAATQDWREDPVTLQRSQKNAAAEAPDSGFTSQGGARPADADAHAHALQWHRAAELIHCVLPRGLRALFRSTFQERYGRPWQDASEYSRFFATGGVAPWALDANEPYAAPTLLNGKSVHTIDMHVRNKMFGPLEDCDTTALNEMLLWIMPPHHPSKTPNVPLLRSFLPVAAWFKDGSLSRKIETHRDKLLPGDAVKIAVRERNHVGAHCADTQLTKAGLDGVRDKLELFAAVCFAGDSTARGLMQADIKQALEAYPGACPLPPL